jgi:fermentation-respiration switch protein FrsA (DUF1100 family)
MGLAIKRADPVNTEVVGYDRDADVAARALKFEAVRKVGKIGSPLLVVHGGEDRLILPDLGRKLYEAAAQPKMFLLVPGGSHHDTNLVGQPQYRQALAQLFQMDRSLADGAQNEALQVASGKRPLKQAEIPQNKE